MLIKVCGMADAENIRAVESLGVDWMGFIFYPRSSRYVGEKVPEYLPAYCRRVGVFVDADIQTIKTASERFELDIVQLHGSESPQFCQELSSQLPMLTIVKAFSISDGSSFNSCSGYEDKVQYFLFDTATSNYGGSGKKFDWTLLDSYKGSTPFFLSGGIGLESVDSLKRLNHPLCFGLDLNSRFELAPALKDVRAIKEFITKLSDKK